MKTGWGYCDSNMKLRISGPFSYVEPFEDGLARVRSIGAHSYEYSLIDTAGHTLLPPGAYWSGSTYGRYNCLNLIDSAGRMGMIDINGRIIVPCLYDRPAPDPGRRRSHAAEQTSAFERAPCFRQIETLPGLFMTAAKAGRRGVVDSSGNIVVPFQFDDVTLISERGPSSESICYWRVRNGRFVGAFTGRRGERFLPRYDAIYPMGGGAGLAAARLGGKMGVVDCSGEAVIAFVYDSVAVDGDKGFSLFDRGRYGWFDVKTRTHLKPHFHEPVTRDQAYLRTASCTPCADKWGQSDKQCLPILLSQKGDTILPPRFPVVRVSGDTIRVGVCEEVDEFRDCRLAIYHPETRLPDSFIASREQYIFTGYVRQPEQPHRQSSHPIHLPGGDRYSTFAEIEGRTWYATSILKADSVTIQGFSTNVFAYAIAEAVPDSENPRFAVIDDRRNILFYVPANRKICGGDLAGGWLIVDSVGYTAVMNLKMELMTPYLPVRIGTCYQHRGKLILQALRTPQRDQYGSYRHEPGIDFFTNCSTLMDEHGRILPGFENICGVNPLIWTWNSSSMVPGDGIFSAMDSLGRTGLVDLDGRTVNRRLSFRRKLHWLSQAVIFKDGHVLRADGGDYFGRAMQSRFGPGTRNGIFYFCTGDANCSEKEFYMDYRGTVYADPEVYQLK